MTQAMYEDQSGSQPDPATTVTIDKNQLSALCERVDDPSLKAELFKAAGQQSKWRAAFIEALDKELIEFDFNQDQASARYEDLVERAAEIGISEKSLAIRFVNGAKGLPGSLGSPLFLVEPSDGSQSTDMYSYQKIARFHFLRAGILGYSQPGEAVVETSALNDYFASLNEWIAKQAEKGKVPLEHLRTVSDHGHVRINPASNNATVLRRRGFYEKYYQPDSDTVAEIMGYCHNLTAALIDHQGSIDLDQATLLDSNVWTREKLVDQLVSIFGFMQKYKGEVEAFQEAKQAINQERMRLLKGMINEVPPKIGSQNETLSDEDVQAAVHHSVRALERARHYAAKLGEEGLDFPGNITEILDAWEKGLSEAIKEWKAGLTLETVRKSALQESWFTKGCPPSSKMDY